MNLWKQIIQKDEKNFIYICVLDTSLKKKSNL